MSSQFNATWDSLTALEQWAEQGVAPANERVEGQRVEAASHVMMFFSTCSSCWLI